MRTDDVDSDICLAQVVYYFTGMFEEMFLLTHFNNKIKDLQAFLVL